MSSDEFLDIDNERPRGPGALWMACSVITVILAAFLRLYDLGLKPLHHDEGVNGWFLTNLLRDGIYKYDPANYHGPTLYYIALGFVEVFGLNTESIRLSVAVWGILTVVLVLFLQKYIGCSGSLAAALFLALSPGMVFISRYFIHEIFFVFLSLAIVAAVVFFIDRERAGPFAIAWIALILLVCFLPSTLNLADRAADPATPAIWGWRAAFFVVELVLVGFVVRMLMVWRNGRPIYLLLAAATAALLFATKETTFITLGTMLIACGCVWLWQRVYLRDSRPDGELEESRSTAANFMSALGNGGDRWLLIAAAAALFVYLFILFFSSFFTYAGGVRGALEAYAIWTKTGSQDHTQNGHWAYFAWGFAIEAPIFVLAAAGIIVAFLRGRSRFALFTAFWAVGLLAAYSLIPYKTPWLALNFLLPMCIIAGYGIGEAIRAKGTFRVIGSVAGAAACAILAYQSYQINFVRYDDDKMPYVYAHTRREFLQLIGRIDHYAQKSGLGNKARIQIVSPDYWPMVWYMRDYPNAVFHGKIAPVDNAEMIVAKKGEQDAEVLRRYAANYKYDGEYELRPGVDLILLVRRDIAGSEGEEVYRIKE